VFYMLCVRREAVLAETCESLYIYILCDIGVTALSITDPAAEGGIKVSETERGL